MHLRWITEFWVRSLNLRSQDLKNWDLNQPHTAENRFYRLNHECSLICDSSIHYLKHFILMRCVICCKQSCDGSGPIWTVLTVPWSKAQTTWIRSTISSYLSCLITYEILVKSVLKFIGNALFPLGSIKDKICNMSSLNIINVPGCQQEELKVRRMWHSCGFALNRLVKHGR